MSLKRLTYIGHHHPDGMLRRVLTRSLAEGAIWVCHFEHGWNGAGQSVTFFYVQPLPTEENRIELHEGHVFVREDAVEPGGPEGGLRLKPRPKAEDWGVPRKRRAR
jgi:hypothetical protein